MITDIDELTQLLAEQHSLRADFNRHVQLDHMGINNDFLTTMQRYEEMTALASRIIEIENTLTAWANSVTLTRIVSY